jgi:UDP-N-acetylmuramoylalanine--D-glutamate ligase
MRTDTTTSGAGLTLGLFADMSGGASRFSAEEREKRVNAVCNDSRKTGNGDVFVAIETENDDGHNYVKKALAQGAIAALVSKKKLTLFEGEEQAKLIAVSDPLTALQKAASRYRATLKCKIVGITGSSGKTTSRAFISAVLRQSHAVSETQGNLNNHIGVPLSLLRFTGQETAGVLEMGANHNREIHVLSNIVRPDIGVIINIGYAHIGYFGSLANIAKAKFEIADGMKKSGVLLLNGDDPLLVEKGSKAKMNVVYFGTLKRCQVRACDLQLTSKRHMRFTVDKEEFELPMPGTHFVYAALAAIAVARQFGIAPDQIQSALGRMKPEPLRGTIEEKAGKTFVVDCYNANPSSMKSGIGLLAGVAGKKPKAAIVGDMLELGKYATRLHTALGRQLAAANVERILAVGEFSGAVAKGARAGGVKRKNIMTAINSEAALPLARAMLKAGDIVLLKGSRGIHLETVYQGLDAATVSQPQKSYPKSYIPKHAAVIGAARSGIGAAKFLKRKGVSVFISDTCSKEKLDKLLAASGLADIGSEAGGHTDAVLANDVIVLSPGVPSDIPVLKKAKSRGIPVWSEIELAYRFTEAQFLAITGSSGKSTTTSLLGAAMAAAGKQHAVAGNIGIPLVNVVEKLPASAFVVAEISSFQLETIDLFRPKAAAVLNFMKNHLDRYESEEAYYNAKKEIARNLTFDNQLVLNSRDARLVEWAEAMSKKTNIVFFGGPAEGRDCVWHENGVMWARIGAKARVLFQVKDMSLAGPHNYDNACAAAALAIAAGIDDAAIAAGICGFKGLPHRLEYVDDINGVKYYNDSKATTAESVLCAITAFSRNVHLIAGGRDKGCDFSILKEAVRTNVKGVYLIGEATGRIAAEFKGLTQIASYETLESAMRAAHDNARTGDVVVLSPGCSSFDMFDNYEHRGEMFAMLVRKMKEEAR